MSFLRDGPAELVALVFDNFRLRDIILASHVCRSWRTIARAHPVFYGEARLVETRPLTAEVPEVQLFMARISSDCGLVAVTVLVSAVASVVDELVLPALLTHMHRTKSLRVSMPEDYSPSFRAILDQPAPALRRFMLEHYRGAPEGTAMVIPFGTWAFSAPAPADWAPRHPYELTEIPALRGVETVRISLPWYYGNIDLETLFTVFPNVRHLDLERVMPKRPDDGAGTGRSVLLRQLEPLSPSHEAIASSLQSVAIEDPSPTALRSLQIANIPAVTLKITGGYSSDVLHEALRHCSTFRASLYRGSLTCTSLDQPGLVYKTIGTRFTTNGSESPFDVLRGSISTLPPLVALSGGFAYPGAPLSLPFVEHLHLVTEIMLIRSRGAASGFFRCDRLSVVVLHSQGNVAYTYRGIADYLECTFTVPNWSAVTVVLHNIATVGGARPPSVLPRFVTWEDVADDERYAWLYERARWHI